MVNLTINMFMELDWRNQILIIFGPVLCGVIIMYVLILEKRTNRKMSLLKSFNQLPTLPLIGSAHLFVGGPRECTRKLLTMPDKYKLPFVAWLAHIPVVCVGKHDDIQTILNTTQTKDLLGIYEKLLGNSILTLHGEKWRRSRRTVTPAFSPNLFYRYFSVFNEYSVHLVKKLQPLCDTGEVFDLGRYIVMMNLNAITENLTGYKIKTSNESLQFINAVSKAVQMEFFRFTVPFLLSHNLYEIYLYLSGNNKVYNLINGFTKKILQDKLAKFPQERHDQQDEIAEDTDAASPKTLIDSLLELHAIDADFTEKHIRAEIFSVISAGYETTAATVCNVLLMLAMHLEVQEKVYDEIKTVFGNDDREVQIEDVKKLVYMEQCINETLRKFAVIPSTLRVHNEDIMLSDGHIIPAGCLIFLGFYLSHHDKTFFPNADNWDPERFSPERYGDCKNAFLPFGGGPRLCIGTKYAMASIKTQLVHLIRRYHFSTEMKMQDIHLVLDILLRNDSGYWLKLHSRPKN